MDPDEAHRLAIAGLDSDDDYAAVTGLTDYSLWVSRGGFPANSDLVDQLDTTATSWADRWDFAWDNPQGGEDQ